MLIPSGFPDSHRNVLGKHFCHSMNDHDYRRTVQTAKAAPMAAFLGTNFSPKREVNQERAQNERHDAQLERKNRVPQEANR